MLFRSNRGGVRIGTSEIYRAVLSIDAVTDALVVDLPHDGSDGRVILFVTLSDDIVLDDDLVAAIRERVRSRCSPRHSPDEVRQIAQVPRTLAGKILEIPVKRILMGAAAADVVSRASLADPLALDYFVELAAELAGRQ